MESMKSLLVCLVIAAAAGVAVGMNFYDTCDLIWNPKYIVSNDGGDTVSLSLPNNSSGCMIRTKDSFLFGSSEIEVQLVKGNSAGTCTTYYLSSYGDSHDEIDFEFLGNVSGQPYTIHTNVYVAGVGDREIQFKAWFDPSNSYHNYTIFWNSYMIVWYVDSIPIRVFRNYESKGIKFPTFQCMYAFSSIWSAESWATQGGRIKSDWSMAPFTAHYSDLTITGCKCAAGQDNATVCGAASNWYEGSSYYQLSPTELGKYQSYQQYKIYDYCHDPKRYVNGTGPPAECALTQY